MIDMASPTSTWQLQMFEKTLKKKQRLQELKKLLRTIEPDQTCLLVSCGDNNGAINYHLREIGGKWSWADLEPTSIEEMQDLLGDDVYVATFDHLPFADEQFDFVVSIDTHEHIQDPVVFTRELWRIAKRNGRIVITVPGGDQRKWVNNLKKRLGMSREDYGHVRHGFSTGELKELMRSARIQPLREVTFSRFFTEMIELMINYMYVKVLSKKSRSPVKQGTIAPQTGEQLRSVGKSYKAYSFVYPVFRFISQLDKLLAFSEGYVVMIEGRKLYAE